MRTDPPFEDSDLSVLPTTDPGNSQPWRYAGGTGWQIVVGAYTAAAGVTDHGALTGLSDDDHTQYYNAARLATALSGYATTSSVAAGYQPLDSDLTAIAALSTTSFGRSLLTQTNAAAALSTLGAQATLVSGTSIKTVGGSSLLGSGNVAIIGGSTGANDNRILRADGTGGATAQNSGLTLTDYAAITDSTNFYIGEATQIITGGSAGLGLRSEGAMYLTTGGSMPTVSIETNGDLTALGAQVSLPGKVAIGLLRSQVYFSGTVLHVRSTQGAMCLFENAGSTSYVEFGLVNDLGGANRCSIYYTGSAYPYAESHPNTLNFFNSLSTSNAWLQLGTANSPRLVITETGLVGFNLGTKVTPSVAFHVGTAARFDGLLFLGVYTVATLPSAAANDGASARVTDSSVTTYRSTVSGGGSDKVKVFSNGTNWLVD